jgi:predicted metalloprotease with PDZ domain
MFGGLPYEKYVYFYFFSPPESNASGALEHLNSHVAFAPPGRFADPENLIGTAAHEYFHTWNVKRIRPAEMWPYDYSRENETPLLWVSEGFTNYYGAMATYRAGVIDQKAFLSRVAGAVQGVEDNEVRKYISPANSSVSTWTGYDTPVAFGISYYTQGQNLGALLDLSIRHDTDGRSGLDDVMRALFNNFYKKNKGFTTEDMIAVINDLTKKDYRDFYRRYVFGTEVPDYNEIFGYAGYKLEQGVSKDPFFGFNGRFRSGGFAINSIEPDSPAAAAGLKQNDVIVKINGEDPRGVLFGDVAGKTLKLTVDRGGSEMELSLAVGIKENASYSLAEIEKPSAAQMKVREGWLKR